MEVMKICPQLVPQDRHGTVYDGFIRVSNEDFRVRLVIPDKQMQQAHLECDWKLRTLLKDYIDLIQMRLKKSRDLPTFLTELKSIAEQQMQSRNSHTVSYQPPPAFYHDLIQQIDALGWQRLSFVDSMFQEIHLVAEDKQQRSHLLKIHLHSQHPREPPKYTTDLPVLFDYHWKESSTLQAVYSYFTSLLDQFTTFWTDMDELDTNTWVLEPEKPNRAATQRRIALGNNSSLHITINPSDCRLCPDCRFMGAEQVISPLREALDNLDQWDPNQSVLRNLQALLHIEFPSAKNSKKEDYSMECGICYSYRMASETPEASCDGPRCRQPFHQTCLYEWLRGLSSSRQSFNTVFGECPYCEKPITVKMPR